MKEWKTYNWGDIITLEYGKPVPDKKSVDGDIPVYGTNGQIGTSHMKPLCPFPSVIIGRKGAYRGVHYSDKPFSVIDTGFYMKPLVEGLNLKWAYYKFLTYDINRMDSGSAIPSTDRYELYKIAVDLPPIEEQNRVVSILDSIDEKIAVNQLINHNLEEQAQALFNDWCSTCQEKKTIGELAANILDYSKNTCSKVILVNSSDVTEGKFEALPYSENENLKGQFKKRFQKGDILFSEIRPRNNHYALCYFNADEYIASTRLIVLRHNANLIGSSTLLYQYIKSSSVQEGFIAKTESRSGTFPQGNYADLASEEVPYSVDNKQLSYLLDGVYKQIWSNLKENDNLVKQRDELLPRLMSGELTC